MVYLRGHSAFSARWWRVIGSDTLPQHQQLRCISHMLKNSKRKHAPRFLHSRMISVVSISMVLFLVRIVTMIELVGNGLRIMSGRVLASQSF